MHLEKSGTERLALGFGGYSCAWGTHMCGLYETDAERDDLVHGYLHQGDIDGDLVRYMYQGTSPDRFREEYARRFPQEAERPNSSGAFTLIPIAERYCPGGHFDPYQSLRIVQAARDQAIREGRHVRSAADMDWVLSGAAGTEFLIPYEARANALFAGGAPLVVICLYDLRKHSGATIMNVLRTHRYSITKGMIVENPTYDPERVLSEIPASWPELT